MGKGRCGAASHQGYSCSLPLAKSLKKHCNNKHNKIDTSLSAINDTLSKCRVFTNSIFQKDEHAFYNNNYHSPMIEDSVPMTQNDLTTVCFQTFKVQGHEISSRSPETKRKFPLSSNRCVKTVAVQTSTPIIITSPVF